MIFFAESLIRSLRSRGVGAPRDHANARTRCHVPCGAGGRAVVPRIAAQPVVFKRGGKAGGCGFPRLGFPPASPFPGPSPVGLRPRLRPRAASGRCPFRVRIIGRGKTHPRSLACARSLGATARRPFSFVVAAALRVPPPENPRRSLNTPIPPQSCGGRSPALGGGRARHVGPVSVVAAVPARRVRPCVRPSPGARALHSAISPPGAPFSAETPSEFCSASRRPSSFTGLQGAQPGRLPRFLRSRIFQDVYFYCGVIRLNKDCLGEAFSDKTPADLSKPGSSTWFGRARERQQQEQQGTDNG